MSHFRVPCPVSRVSALLVILLTCGSAMAGTVDRIVAVVNDDVITEAELAAHTRAFLGERPGAPTDERALQARRSILRRLIEDRLVLQEAKRLEYAVTVDELDAKITDIHRRFESDAEFQASLAESGITLEQYRQQLREQLLTQKAIDAQVRDRITISPQDVTQELALHPDLSATGDRLKLRHLLIRTGEGRSEAEAKQLAQRLAKQISGGAAFSDVAKQHSDDAHAASGGEMGWVAAGQLLPELDAALAHLPTGQVCEPVKSSLGYHLAVIEERKDASELAPQDANNAVYRAIYERKFQAEMRAWVDRLLKDAYIEVAQDQ